MHFYPHKISSLFPLREKIFSIHDSPAEFEQLALEVFSYQFEGVHIFRDFCNSLKQTPSSVKSMVEIPFLPVEFFKSNEVRVSGEKPERIFESSTTTGSNPSKHYVADVSLYEMSFLSGFKHFYSNPKDYVILSLLPSYIERGNSSLVYMADKLIHLTERKESGFFLNEFQKLRDVLQSLRERKQKTILLGVTYALLDFADKYKIEFPELIVMETGGMKGRREELTRAEVHQQLSMAFGVEKVHSEYGMTEMLSQAYSKGDGVFRTPPWLKVLTRDIYDPFRLQENNITGAINVIDLANLYSCSFLATGDLGNVKGDGSFEILGRMDNAEIRGCNLMAL